MQLEQSVAKKSDVLVIHFRDPSTDFLKTIYTGKNYTVINSRDTRKLELARAIDNHSKIYMMGHGAPSGLFGPGYSIDDSFAPLLRGKDNLYIWCNADSYVSRNKLTGFSSGMFISEVGEAAHYGIRATQQEVNYSNNLFAKIVRECLDAGNPLSTIAKQYTHATDQIIKFNSERLYIFNSGNPTPALHPTSHANFKYSRPDSSTESL